MESKNQGGEKAVMTGMIYTQIGKLNSNRGRILTVEGAAAGWPTETGTDGNSCSAHRVGKSYFE